ncbi:MAG: hypothetical protein WBQ69_04570, partial [Gallionella sp.]
FWTYWLAFKEKGWEIFWGPTLLGIIFGIYTLWHSPARVWFLAYVLIVVYLTGYYLWRAYHVRLMPRLELNTPLIVDTTTNIAQLNRRFVQIPATCLTQTRLDNCGGQLLRVWKRVDNDWQLTQVDEPLDLNWSILDLPTTFLEQNVNRRLNVFFLENINRNINFASSRVPFRMALSSAPFDVFRFDVRIGAPDCPPGYLSFKVTFGQNWNDITVQELEAV